jgi:hypothetical protein
MFKDRPSTQNINFKRTENKKTFLTVPLLNEGHVIVMYSVGFTKKVFGTC